MSSTYSPDLRIELIGTGDQAGVWGNTTNTNLGTVLEQAIAGYTSVSISSANQALTVYNGVSDESRNAAIALTTVTSANFAVYVPPSSKVTVFYNTSVYTATIYCSTVAGNTTAAGTGIAIPAGKKMALWTDGTNVYQQTDYMISPTLATPSLTTPTLTTPKVITSINDTNGNELIAVTATSSAVNEITVANAATGNKPTISATGGDTNISLDLVAKGTGTVQIGGVDAVTTSGTQTLTNKTLTSPKVGTAIADTNGNELIAVTATASAVNEITVANAATGNKPTISATGGDTNISLNLVSKGTGTVQVGGVDIVTTSGTQTLTNKSLTSPSMSGTPTTPTATLGTNTTQIASTAFVQAAIQAVYPVGAIYISTSATNPGTTFGFGTWTAYGAGRTIIGAGGGYTAGSTGGSADAIVVSHTHTASSTFTGTALGNHSHTITDPGHAHTQRYGQGGGGSVSPTWSISNSGTTVEAGNFNVGTSMTGITGTDAASAGTPAGSVSTTVDSTGSSGTGANLPPYIVTYIWQRTA